METNKIKKDLFFQHRLVSSLKSMVKLISCLKEMDSCFRRNDSYVRFTIVSFLA